MTTKVGYTFDGQHRDRFMAPAEAYNLLEAWNESNFDRFLGKKIETVNCDLGYMNALILDRNRGGKEVNSPGGVVMCGTTGDLKRSFHEFNGKKDGVRGICGTIEDELSAYFVRGKSSTFADVKTLINIGPDRYWWGMVGDKESFKPGKWKLIPDPDPNDYMSKFTNPRICWSFKELIDVLDRLEKPLEGEKKVEILDW